MLYCSYLALVRGLAVSTIQNHLSAVRQEHLAAGFLLPTPSDYFPLRAALRGAKRFLSRPVRQKLPVSPSLLARLVATTEWGSPMRCLFLMLWLTFSRLASIIPASANRFSPRLHLAWRHITFTDNAVTVTLETTKTIQCKERTLVFIVERHKNDSICLWRQLQVWRSTTTCYAPESPVFLTSTPSPRPLSRGSADPVFKAALALAGAQSAAYGWSSFRRGGASTYFLATGDVETLRAHGDWASDAYTRYLSIPASQRSKVASKIQNLIK